MRDVTNAVCPDLLCQAIYLHVYVENSHAISLYKKLGFQVTKTLWDYYQFENGDLKDALVCILYINGGRPRLSTFVLFPSPVCPTLTVLL